MAEFQVANLVSDVQDAHERQHAQVVKLVDTLASGVSGLAAVEVQVLSWAPSS